MNGKTAIPQTLLPGPEKPAALPPNGTDPEVRVSHVVEAIMEREGGGVVSTRK
jgi:hypothetical protein